MKIEEFAKRTPHPNFVAENSDGREDARARLSEVLSAVADKRAENEQPKSPYYYLNIAEEYEREYQFDKVIEYLKLYFAEEYRGYEVAFDKRGSKKYRLKYYIYRCGRNTGDFYYQFYRLSEFYLRMGTQFLKDYWVSLRNSPYYEDDSYFKAMVENGILIAEEKQAAGYIYRPATKANREKFLAYAKERGWR